MNKNIFSKRNLAEFFEKKSFYIMLVLSVFIVIFSGLFIASRNIISSIGFENEDENFLSEELQQDEGISPVNAGKIEEEAKTSVDARVTVDSSIAMDDKVSSEKVSSGILKLGDEDDEFAGKSSSSSAVEAYKEENHPSTAAKVSVKNNLMGVDQGVPPKMKSEKSSSGSTPKKIKKLYLPVLGTVLNPFSVEKPIFSKTLNEWRKHEGMDIAANAGSQVKSAENGIVSDIKNDPRFGFTISIDHKDGLVTKYAALNNNPMVVIGQNVLAGDVIGSLGNSAPFESLEPAHLHFEVLINNKNEDPRKFLPQLQD